MRSVHFGHLRLRSIPGRIGACEEQWRVIHPRMPAKEQSIEQPFIRSEAWETRGGAVSEP